MNQNLINFLQNISEIISVSLNVTVSPKRIILIFIMASLAF